MVLTAYALIGFSSFFLIVVPITGGIVLNPLLALVVDPHVAVSMTVFFFAVNSFIKAVVFHDHIVWKYFWNMLAVSALAAMAGTWAIGLVPETMLYLVMLAMTLHFTWKHIAKMTAREPRPKGAASRSGDLVTSAVSGFMQGVGLGGGGSLRKSYFLSHGLSLLQMHGTTSALSVVLGVVSTGLRLQTDQVTWTQLLPIAYLIPVMIAATVLGKLALVKLSQRTADRVILLTLVATTVLLGWKVAVELA
ncbi:TSUP family transporter [Salinarimonas sp. NSM]|uniref:TSUP family transporter n=1 Tax=Salinarimonas sp. NSM TaxID=3458003 RepID=UPI004035D02A